MPAPDFDFDEEEHRTRHESPLGLPAPDKLYQRMECAGRLVRRHEEDPSLNALALCCNEIYCLASHAEDRRTTVSCDKTEQGLEVL